MNNAIHVGCLVANAVGGRIGKNFQREVEKFLSHNGPEWTSKRLKAIWTAALHLRNHDGELARKIYQDNSIAYHSDLFPKGSIGKAVRVFTTCSKPSALRRWSALLRYYTGIHLGKPSKKQIQDAYHNITDEFSGNKDSGFWKRIADFSSRYTKGKKSLFKAEWFYLGGIKGSTRYFSPYKLPNNCRNLYYGSCVHSLLSTEWVPPQIDHLIPSIEIRKYRRELAKERDWVIGKIVIIQEGGAKARVVAMPNAWLQLGFYPFHKSLSILTEDIFPESCVRDQLRGVKACLYQLRLGGDCYSLDLTAATDRLPLEFSLSLIESLRYGEYIDAFREVVKMPWEFPFIKSLDEIDGHSQGPWVNYSVGQPMGLYGSFPLLHFSNLMIGKFSEAITLQEEMGAKAMWEDLRNPSRAINFVVLGDDIVFFNKAMAEVYRAIMRDLGVEISPTKSFSKDIVQFAGFTILKAGENYHAFRPYKHPTEGYVRNPIEFLHALGSSVSQLRDPKWERMYFEYTQTIGNREMDLSPAQLELDPRGPAIANVDTRWILSVRERLLQSYPDKEDSIGALYTEDPPWNIPWHLCSKSQKPLVLEERFDQIVGYSPADFEFQREREAQVGFRVPGLSFFRDPLIAERRKILEETSRLKPENVASGDSKPMVMRPVTAREAVLATTRPSDRKVSKDTKPLAQSSKKKRTQQSER